MRSVVPYLCVRDAARAIDWYKDVFAAELVGDPIVMDDGKVGHAELRIGASTLYLADEYPEEGVRSPLAHDSVTSQFMLYVDDADAVFVRAVEAGAHVWRPVEDTPYGDRSGKVRDPFGQNWFIATPSRPSAAAPVQGVSNADANLGYFTFEVPDARRAADFYRAVCGWDPVPGSMPQGFHLANADPPGGILGGKSTTGILVSLRVDDLDAAVERVRTFGGHADEPVDHPSGRSVSCRDDQGVRFDLWEPAPGY